jgi:hypothetical protein
MKNILAENMRRFRTKNISEQTMPDPVDLMQQQLDGDTATDKRFPAGTVTALLTDRSNKSKTAQIAFVSPRSAKGPFTWKPFTSSAQPNAMVTSVQIEYREGNAEWQPATLRWVSNAPYLLLIKLQDGTNQSNFENKSLETMFTRAHEAHLKTPPATTQDADAF